MFSSVAVGLAAGDGAADAAAALGVGGAPTVEVVFRCRPGGSAGDAAALGRAGDCSGVFAPEVEEVSMVGFDAGVVGAGVGWKFR